MLIIGFGNKSRQGKDTAAEAIKDHFDKLNQLNYRHMYKLSAKPINVGIFKFATALYQETNEAIREAGSAEELFRRRYIKMDMWTPNSDKGNIDTMFMNTTSIVMFPDWVQPDPDPVINSLAPYGKHPKLLQWWGTELRRNNFGENYWVDKLFASIPANTDIALISDVRFLNEADGIKQRGGHCVNVQRLREDGSQYFSTDRHSDHPSETMLDNYNWDYYIKSKEGDAGWTAEQAITLVEYLRGLQR